ncbi:MAG: glycosyltransferase [Acidobacteriota bacterium]|nr:glycosyltransferase [Acidobacteriota bacterium]
MKICIIGKYPPIEGGVSREMFWSSHALAEAGHEVHVVTNADEVEQDFRMQFPGPSTGLPGPPQTDGNPHVHQTTADDVMRYIPWANPFVTKLATLAAEVVRQHQCDLILGYYLEPYGMAAHLAGSWTGVPYGIRNAGSDVGRLARAQSLQTAYIEVFRAADFILAGAPMVRPLIRLGVDPSRIYAARRAHLPPRYFDGRAAPMDIDAVLADVLPNLPRGFGDGVYHRLAKTPFRPDLPTIGIYGKTGTAKGSFDLIRALAALKELGHQFNFLALTQSRPELLASFAADLHEHGLEDRTRLLPFVPHWNIPNFLAACHAVCFLERDFHVKVHQPIVPREVLAAGTCLILSHEIAEKQPFREHLRRSENVLLTDPKDSSDLAAQLRFVMTNPEEARAVGRRGREQISQPFEDWPGFRREVSADFETILADSQMRRKLVSISEMQACLARLYMDQSFKRLFELEPDRTLKNYHLTDQETESIKSIDRKVLDYFALSLKAKYRERLLRSFPLLQKVVPADTLKRYFTRFFQLYVPKPEETTVQQVADFGGFIAEVLAADDSVPAFAADVARYEALFYRARFTPTGADTLARLNKALPPARTEFSGETVVKLEEGVYAEVFSHKILDLVDRLNEDAEPGEVPSGQFPVVFRTEPRTLQPKVFHINPAMMAVLRAAGTGNTVDGLIEEVERELGARNLAGKIRPTLVDLMQRRLMTQVETGVPS